MNVEYGGNRGWSRWRWVGWVLGVVLLAAPAWAAEPAGEPIVVERFAAPLDEHDLAALQRGALTVPVQRETPAAVTPPAGRTTWYRLQLVREWVSPREPVLVITQANDIRVRVYGPSSQGDAEYSIYGSDGSSVRTRRLLVVPLPQGWNGAEPLYLRVDAATATTHALIVTDRQAAHEAELVQARMDVAWPVLQLVLLLAGLMVLRPRSNRLGALYLGLTASIALATACKSGLAFEYWPTTLLAPLGLRANALAATAVGVFTLALATAWLELPRWAPRLARLVVGYGGVLVVFLVVCVLPLPDAWLIRVTSVLVGVALSLSWLAGVLAWRRRRHGAAPFVLAWSPALVVLLLRMLQLLTGTAQPPALGMWQSVALTVATLAMLHLLAQRVPRAPIVDPGSETMRERDVLTGALSRSSGFARLRASFLSARSRRWPLAVLSCDLGAFLRQRANGCARSEIDACLCEITATLRAHLRRGDAIVRCGDDRMVAILPKVDRAAADDLARRIARQIDAAALDLGGVPLGRALALGVACIDDGTHAPEDLLDRALAAGQAARTRS